MEYVVGMSLALGVAAFASIIGFDRDRAFYPVVLVVTASYYELFAVLSGSAEALSLETAAFSVFVLVAVIGFKANLWFVVGALVGHGIFDFVHGGTITNPGVPAWWPMFCLSYDVVAALYLAWRLGFSGLDARPPAAATYGSDNMGAFRRHVRPHVESELAAADACARRHDFAEGFRHLERAHVLAQMSTIDHVRVHWRMLVWGFRQKDLREVRGQIPRLLGAAALTAIGLVPWGNTGGSNVPPLRRMPIPEDLQAVIALAGRGM